MAQPFVAEIKLFSGNFAPTGWAFCNGQLLPISQNTALFSILGTSFGGDGKSTFALPNLNGRAPIGAGQGPGLSDRAVGETGGQSEVTLTRSEIPAHTHVPQCNSTAGGQGGPGGNVWGKIPGKTAPQVYSANAPDTALAAAAVGNTGGDQPHNNMQPYLGLTFIIALQGIFPPRH
jgi:microcystin-dependent protein